MMIQLMMLYELKSRQTHANTTITWHMSSKQLRKGAESCMFKFKIILMCLSAILRNFPDDEDDNLFAYLFDAYFKQISFPKVGE